MKLRQFRWVAALAAMVAAHGAAAQAPAEPVIDVASIAVPDLRFEPTGTDLQKYPRNFYAYKPGVSFTAALADLRDCERISAVTQTPFSFPGGFIPFGPDAADRPDFQRRNIGGGMLGALSEGLVTRNVLLANRRECLMYKGYTLYGVTSAAWEAIEANGPEMALQIRAKLASGPVPVQPVAFTPAAPYPVLAPPAAQAPEIVHARKPAAITLKPGSAYILFRTKVPKGAVPYNLVLVRELLAEEREGYERARAEAFAKAKNPERFTFVYEAFSNVIADWPGRRFADSGDDYYFFYEVPPGTYLIAGTSNTCLCMGSVKFDARAGHITDLGYYLAGRLSRDSVIPELAPLTSRPKLRSHMLFLMASAIRPWRSDMPVPEELKALPRVGAEYRAVGPLPNLFGVSIGRLAPLQGVLGYDVEGRAIDVRTGRQIPPSD